MRSLKTGVGIPNLRRHDPIRAASMTGTVHAYLHDGKDEENPNPILWLRLCASASFQLTSSPELRPLWLPPKPPEL